MNLTADYLIIGSGAMGMAFADVLVEESEATLIIVDKKSLLITFFILKDTYYYSSL